MSKYKDRYGAEIKVGDVVVHPVTINHQTHIHPFTLPYYFDIGIIKKKGNSLIKDGIYCWGYLRHVDTRQIINLSRLQNKDLRDVFLVMRKLTQEADR